jgi:NSS family neurotransmitter:Na+ symporter
MAAQRETWKTHIGMMIAMIGTEVGLGNVWRFPYLCGKYGGGSFLVPYIVLLLGVAMFGMMSEWVIGRHTRREPMGAFHRIGFPFGRDVGAWGVIGPFFLYSYYIVVTAWVLFFIVASVAGLYFGADTKEYFLAFLGSPWVFVAHAVAVAFTSIVLSFGVQKGIERACKVMIPALFVLLIVVAIRSLTLPGAARGVEFYMRPRWEGIANAEAWLAALGQVFFTLSLGMGAMIIYGSYMKRSWGIPLNAFACSLGNTSASILAGFAIFPAAFALGFAAEAQGNESVMLTFTVLPKVFATMDGGWFFGGLFFLLLAFGALSSAISIQEPAIAWMKEELRWPRRKSALITGGVLWLMGLPFVVNGFVSHNAAGQGAGVGEKLALLIKMDKVINYVGLPLFALIAILAVGWVMKNKGFEELNRNARVRIGSWIKPWMRYVVPVLVLVVLLANVFEQFFGETYKRLFGAEPTAFTSIGITPVTVLTIIVVCGVVWGGAIGGFITVVGIERRKEREAAATGGPAGKGGAG